MSTTSVVVPVNDCELGDAAPPVPPHTEASSEPFQNEPNSSNEELYPSSGQAQAQGQNKVAYIIKYCTHSLMFVTMCNN